MITNVKGLPEVGTVLIKVGNQFLAIGRKTNPKDFGFLGGKREPGDTSVRAAAAREAFEEAGITVVNLLELYAGEDSNHFWVVTFFVGEFFGVPGNMGQGNVEWVKERDLLAGSWPEYNREVLVAHKTTFPNGKDTICRAMDVKK